MKAEDARSQRERAEELLQPGGKLVEGCGEAVDWQTDAEIPDRVVEDFADTLERPTSVSAGASEARLRALRGLDVVKAGLDASQTAKVANSIEKMLVHQMTAAHFQAMRLLESAHQGRLQPVDLVRLVNAAVRMFDVYQAAALTLQKLKSKGQQRVIVQYQQVNIGDGGQADFKKLKSADAGFKYLFVTSKRAHDVLSRKHLNDLSGVTLVLLESRTAE